MMKMSGMHKECLLSRMKRDANNIEDVVSTVGNILDPFMESQIDLDINWNQNLSNYGKRLFFCSCKKENQSWKTSVRSIC